MKPPKQRNSSAESDADSSPRYGKQTQLAVQNFAISGRRLPSEFIQALIRVKFAAAKANHQIGNLEVAKAQAIQTACQNLLEDFSLNDFPVDVFQTGSGTSTNMNVNEVIAQLANQQLRGANQSDTQVHPNDDVNRCQSSNDTIPTALHLSAAGELQNSLRPALVHLSEVIGKRSAKLGELTKTARTHLMDAVPIRCEQELSGWQAQIDSAIARLDSSFPRLCELPLGATAVGTGINAVDGFAQQAIDTLRELTQLPVVQKPNLFEGLSCQDSAVELSGQIKVLAVALMKIANDLRWMNSGPYAGLGEIRLPELQPGSSIMPGKVNPVIPEAVCMAAAQVIGNDTCITVAGQSGQFQLNVMLPVIADNLLCSSKLMTNACLHLADKAIADMQFNEQQLAEPLLRNPILVTALNSTLGYDQCAKIAKEAYHTGEPILDVAERLSTIPRNELERLLDPQHLTQRD